MDVVRYSLKRLSFVLLGVLLSATVFAQTSPTPLGPGTAPAAATTQDPRLARHSKELQLILKTAQKHFGVSQISIGGGTARALIAHVLTGQPFEFRDFDIVFSAEQTVTAQAAERFGQELEKMRLGHYSAENLRPRPRFNPALDNVEAAKSHNAGFGFFVNTRQNVEYDISVFHSRADLALNGIMDVDRLQVIIDDKTSLADLVRDSIRFHRHIIDPENAVIKVLSGAAPAIANWGAVTGDPAMIAIRVVRTLAKFGALPMNEFEGRRIRQLIESDSANNKLQITRNLWKLLGDAHWIQELKSLEALGLFTRTFSSFPQALENPQLTQAKTASDRLSALFENVDKNDALDFLKTLESLEPELIKKVLPKLIEQKRLRVGYFTGEFGPFTHGHESVVQTALNSKAVDLIFVLAVPHVTNEPKTTRFSPLEWAERCAFVRAGLQSQKQAWGWPLVGVKTEDIRNLSADLAALSKFVKEDGARSMTHIFGMDSYHRVLSRGLLDLDPRTRIVVTRPGVPAPRTLDRDEDRVIVLENTFDKPTSATRALHDLAISGKTASLNPKVITVVQQTPRYQRLLKDYAESREDVRVSLVPVKDYTDKSMLLDIRENHAGFWDTRYPHFGERHAHILRNLAELGPAEIVILMKGENSQLKLLREHWSESIKGLGLSVPVRIAEKSSDIIPSKKILVVHSGMVNEMMKKGSFVNYFGDKRKMVIYETPDQPLTALIRTIPGLDVVGSTTSPVRNLRCEALLLNY